MRPWVMFISLYKISIINILSCHLFVLVLDQRWPRHALRRRPSKTTASLVSVDDFVALHGPTHKKKHMGVLEHGVYRFLPPAILKKGKLSYWVAILGLPIFRQAGYNRMDHQAFGPPSLGPRWQKVFLVPLKNHNLNWKSSMKVKPLAEQCHTSDNYSCYP